MALIWDTLPLAINMVGPMAFKVSTDNIDIWMPKLDNPKYKHQAAIGTNVGSYALGVHSLSSDYILSDPDPLKYDGTIAMYYPPKEDPSIPYMVEPDRYPPESYFVHITLPKPKCIISLNPVPCKIKYDGTMESNCHRRPTGFRLLYERTGIPNCVNPANPNDSVQVVFDGSELETHSEMFISYSPYDFDDPTHAEAISDFESLGAMCGLNLSIEFDACVQAAPSEPLPRKTSWMTTGPLNDCKAANLILI